MRHISRVGRACRVVAAVWLAARSVAVADSPGTRRALIICGLPGDDEHSVLFAGAVGKLSKALTGTYGFAAPDVFVRFGVEAKAQLPESRGLSTREGIAADVAELRKRLTPDDTLWVIVLGHGHYDGRHSHLNVPGPDLDERAFAKLFQGIKAREQVFMITTSASGFFTKPLAAPGRIVITATEADREVNETLFPLALADALTTPPEGIDRDKDGSVSVFELYLAVVADVMKRYVDDENLASEHAKLDDNGDGHGSEVQERYLPEELGGRIDSGKKAAAAPVLGPKDDGALASRVLVDRPGAKKP